MKPERITAPTLLVHGLQNRVNTFEAAPPQQQPFLELEIP